MLLEEIHKRWNGDLEHIFAEHHLVFRQTGLFQAKLSFEILDAVVFVWVCEFCELGQLAIPLILFVLKVKVAYRQC